MRFVSDISIWWLLPWLGVCILLSLFLYRKESWISDLKYSWQITLKVLRAAGLFIFGLLLLGLMFEAVNFRVEKPVFITLVDNSSSMRNYRDSNEVKSKIQAFDQKVRAKFGDKFDFVQYTVGSDVEENGVLNFKESTSLLASGFEAIHTQFYNRNVGGIAFFSDGNFNKGANPIYSAEKINLTPVFAVGVGDTIAKKDQYIKSVVSNEVAFLKNKFPVEIDVEAIKMGLSNAVVSIHSNGQQIASQAVSFNDGTYDYKHLSFLLEATKVGYQQYTVSISKGVKEHSYLNNSRNFYIEILDTRSKVILLAGAPHPDVAALKNVLEKDDNLEVKAVLAKDWDGSLSKVDLVIWHEPGVHFDAALQGKLEEAKIPVFYCLGPNTSSTTVGKLSLGMSTISGNQTDEVQAKINSGFQLFELSTDLQAAMNFFPPLKIKFGEVKVSAGTDVLLFQRIGTIPKRDPLLFFGTKNGTKYGVLYGEGIWRWKINEYVRSGEEKNFTEFIQKITQFLVVKQNTSSLRISTPKRFTKDEEIELKGEFYNSSLELITSPDLDFTLQDEKSKITKHQFGVVGNYYKLIIGKLKPGKYNWTAKCKHNGKSHIKNGTFLVEDILLESIDSRANHTLLNQLAENSTGKFYTLGNTDQLIEDLEGRDDLVEMSYKETSFNDLIDYKMLFFLLIALFSLEWFLRRWFGAY
jgi:hypothetical protein